MTDYSDLKTVAPEDLWRVTPEDYTMIKSFEDDLYTNGYAMVFSDPEDDRDDLPVTVFQDTLAYRPEFKVTPEHIQEFYEAVQEQAQKFYKAEGIILKTMEGAHPIDGSLYFTVLVASKDLVELYWEEIVAWKMRDNFNTYIMNGWGS